MIKSIIYKMYVFTASNVTISDGCMLYIFHFTIRDIGVSTVNSNMISLYDYKIITRRESDRSYADKCVLIMLKKYVFDKIIEYS